MRRCRVILSRHPVIKSSISRLRLCGTIEHAVAVPFPRHARGIARVAQQLRQRDFMTPKMNQITRIRWQFCIDLSTIRLPGFHFRNPVVNSRTIR